MKCVNTVRGMSFHAFHGILEVERELGQVFTVDVSVEFDVKSSWVSSKAEPLVRDADVYEITRNVMMETKFRSVMSLAGKIAHNLMAEYSSATAVLINIYRRQLFVPGNVDSSKTEVSYTRADFEAQKG